MSVRSLDSAAARAYRFRMNLKKVLTPSVVTPSLQGRTKHEVIEALVDMLCATGKVADRALALNAVLEREAKMSTGMAHGIAIPHGKTDAVESLVACVGVTPEEVEFESLDGRPCRIFIMTLSPLNRTGPHIQFLAEISQLLKSPDRRERLIAATTPDAMLRVLTE